MTMNTITSQASDVSRGIRFVDLLKVDSDQFQLLAQRQYDRDCEYLNRPYELSDLMRQAL
jgi:hypothetical protein